LNRIKEVASDDSENIIPVIVEAVKAYASIGEICGALREVWGEWERTSKF
jgi:methylmalonyl-CoA mutase N-terminal domain/subunit